MRGITRGSLKLPTISVDNSLDSLGVGVSEALVSYVRFKLFDLRSELHKYMIFKHLR